MKLTSLVAFLLCASPALAQGSDACASAQAIAGTGQFAFDNSAATTDGVPDNLCLAFGTSQIERDVWFSWIAGTTDQYKIAACGLTTVDTRIAVYDGSCAGTVLACNDDTCGLQSQVQFPAQVGNTYVIRVGVYPSALGGTGSIDIQIVLPPPPPTILATAVNPANGHTYHLLSSSSWTVAEGYAVVLGGHLATVRSQAEHDWLRTSFHNYQGTDIDLWTGFNDVALEGTFAWSSGEPVTYTNWDLNEPNDAGGVEDYGAMRKNNPNALWNDLANDPTGFHAGPHGVVELDANVTSFCAGDGLDPLVTTACPCGNSGVAGRGCDNSAGTGGAVISATGGTNPDTLVLSVSGELPTALSIFLQGNNTAPAGIVFGDGVRCVTGVLKRLYTKSAVGGVVSAPQPGDDPITTRSAALGDPIAAGTMRWYQVYSRDANPTFCPTPTGSTFNISNGAAVQW